MKIVESFPEVRREIESLLEDTQNKLSKIPDPCTSEIEKIG